MAKCCLLLVMLILCSARVELTFGDGNVCANDQFECENGKCIPASWRCDGDDDCSDTSDETSAYCNTKTCDENQFACSDGTCIPLTWKCDKEVDCTSATDEKNCNEEYLKCRAEEFDCGNDRHTCISKTWVCDDEIDCPSDADERNCSKCEANEFQCKAGSVTCVSLHDVCDGKEDCSDFSDETNCKSILQCHAEEFRCQGDGNCIHQDKRCNGLKDCNDLSDEKNCTELQCPKIKTEIVFLLDKSYLVHKQSLVIAEAFAERASDRLHNVDDEIRVVYSGRMNIWQYAATDSMIELEQQLNLSGVNDKMSTKKFDAQNMVNVSTEDSCTDVFVIWIVDKIPKDFENVTTLLKSTGVLPIVILISDKQQSAVKKIDWENRSIYVIEDLSGVTSLANRISAKIIFRKSFGHIWRALVRLVEKHS